MSMQDPISDMMTRIRNAQAAKKAWVDMPHSKMKEAIVSVLSAEGYVESFEMVEHAGRKTLHVVLKYYLGSPVIVSLKRVSKPSLRVYHGSDMPEVQNGLGISIVSTPKGVMTGRQAKKINQGGEILCYVA